MLQYKSSIDDNSDCVTCAACLGVVHNCQHLPISTESTNLGGGSGAEAS